MCSPRCAVCSDCSMAARAVFVVGALVALLSVDARYYKPDATIVLTHPGIPYTKPVTPELSVQLHQVKSDALDLYTEFCSKAAVDLKTFLGNVSNLAEDYRRRAYSTLASSPDNCRYDFQAKVQKIELDAHKAATFSTETHHKFLLGPMILFRMHLNKSEEYIRRCDRTASTCGAQCEGVARQLSRWRRLAQCEINRVREDVEHARKAYPDVILHAYRKLNHLRKHTNTKLHNAVAKLLNCAQQPYQADEPKGQ